MARIPWQFHDPVVDETYYWEINPNDGGYPERTKSIAYNATSAPDGQTVAFEGREAPMSFSFSGVILTQTQFEVMNTWYEKKNQIQLTDDLGRSFWIYIRTFSPRRQRSASHPWKHNYTMEAIILDWA
jgi:hypothetical protein